MKTIGNAGRCHLIPDTWPREKPQNHSRGYRPASPRKTLAHGPQGETGPGIGVPRHRSTGETLTYVWNVPERRKAGTLGGCVVWGAEMATVKSMAPGRESLRFECGVRSSASAPR